MIKLKTKARKVQWTEILSSLAVIMVLAAFIAAPAHADPRGRDHWDHGRDDWHRHHGPPPRGYVYAPPVVYSAPPPPLGLNLIIPLHIS